MIGDTYRLLHATLMPNKAPMHLVPTAMALAGKKASGTLSTGKELALQIGNAEGGQKHNRYWRTLILALNRREREF